MVLQGGDLFIAVGPSGVIRMDTTSGAVLGSWNLGANATYITSDGTKLWVTLNDIDSIAAIEPGVVTPEFVALTGQSPQGIEFGEGYVWVANAGSDTVERVDPATPLPTTSISVGDAPRGVAVDPGPGGRVFVSSSNDHLVTVVHADSATVVDTWDPASALGLRGMHWDEANDRLWVAGLGSDSIDSLDGTTGVTVGIFDATVDPNVGAPRELASDGSQIWAVNTSTDTLSRFDDDATTPLPRLQWHSRTW